MKKLLLCAALGLLFASCTDNSPDITINSPSDGQTFSSGDKISFQGTITDDGQITGISLSSEIGLFPESELDLSGATDRSSLIIDGLSVTIATVTQAGKDIITFQAVDDEDNVTKESVTIHLE